MLAVAAAKARELGLPMSLQIGDIRRLPAGDGSFDAAVCVRFLNWVDAGSVRSIVDELARVSRRLLIIGIRHFAPVSDLQLPSASGLRRLARQMLRRIRRRWLTPLRRPRARIIVHEKRRVLEAFTANRLEIRSAVRIDAGRNGTDYCIYVLEKVDR
jgi:hypothetical protein